MATEIIMRKVVSFPPDNQEHSAFLVPTDKLGIDALANLKGGEFFKVSISVPRNIKFHRLFFGLLNLVFENQEMFATLDGMLDTLKIATGHFDMRTAFDGSQFPVPKSISFAAMNAEQFRQFYDRVFNLILEKILPHTTKKQLEQMIFEMVGMRGPDDIR